MRSDWLTPTDGGENNALFDGHLDSCLIADSSSLRFLAANPPVCDMLGYTEEELLQLSVPDIHPTEDHELIRNHFVSSLRLKTPATETLRFLRKDGSVFNGCLSAYSIQYQGRLCQIGFVRDKPEEISTQLTSENVFKSFISKSAYGFVDFDAKGFVRTTNARFAAILGYDGGELRGVHFLELLDKSEHERAKSNFNESEKTVRNLPRKYLARKKNGETCSVELSSIALTKSGELVGYQMAILDISAREEAKAAREKSEAMLRSLVENMPSMVMLVDREARVKYINRGVGNYTPEEVVGQTDFDLVHPDYFQACRESLQKAFSTQSVQHIEALDNSGVWWSCQQVPMIENGRAETVMIICNDVTRQKEADAKIRQEQELLRRMLEMHERDRELIAFEIHDGFSQQLAGALMNLDASVQSCSDDPKRSKESFEKGVQLLRESIAESRRLVAGLRPPVLEEFGIIPAIEQLIIEHTENGGPQTEFSSNILEQRLAPSLESAIFRIVQEALNNARRHSQSDQIRLDIYLDCEHVHLVIQDWGVGFEPEEIGDNRFGLKGIRERARLLGGHSRIDAQPGKGTCITIELPILLESRPENEVR